MKTTWIVEKITATPGRTVAELTRVEWYKRNPAYDEAMADETFDSELPDEFLDAEPGAVGAESMQIEIGSMSLETTDGLDLRPGDNVIVTVDAVDRVPA